MFLSCSRPAPSLAVVLAVATASGCAEDSSTQPDVPSMASDASTEAATLLVRARDEATLGKIRDTVIDLARQDARRKGESDPIKIATYRDVTAYQLDKAGLQVRIAKTGEEGLEAARRGADLVLLDLNLPDMDGLEVCRLIRRQTATAHVPVIIVSARADEVDRVLGLEMGADDYVVKPFSLKELAARARVALRRADGPAQAAQGYRDDAEWFALGGKLPCEVLDRGLGDAVRRHSGHRHGSRSRRDVDDTAPASPRHVVHRFARAQERAVDVRLEQALDVVEAHLGHP